jgi:hypothetical protein
MNRMLTVSEPVRNFLEPRQNRLSASISRGWGMSKKNRRRYERRGLRYESDLTDEEYALIEQFPPKRGGFAFPKCKPESDDRNGFELRPCRIARSPRRGLHPGVTLTTD